MSFQPAPGKQELASRKILEEIQMQKKLLKQGGPLPNPTTVNPVPLAPQPGQQVSAPTANPELQSLNPTQRAALQHAHAHSFGYYVTQESAYGNLILPVIPRLEPVAPSK